MYNSTDKATDNCKFNNTNAGMWFQVSGLSYRITSAFCEK